MFFTTETHHTNVPGFVVALQELLYMSQLAIMREHAVYLLSGQALNL